MESSKILNIKDLGQVVRGQRAVLGMTQEKAAGLLGISRKLLSEIETGRKDTIQMGKILQVLTRMGLEIHLRPRGPR